MAVSFFDQHRFRNGKIVNYGWCGTCAIPEDRLQKLISDKHTELTSQGHTCSLLSDSGTLLWWCGETPCNPANFEERESYASLYENDGTHYIGKDPTLENFSKQKVSSDIYYLSKVMRNKGHHCLRHIDGIPDADSYVYAWCGSETCTSQPGEGDDPKMDISHLF
jgi:hypothetical protein